MNTAKILLVEDQLIQAYDMKQQLEELGYSVKGVFTDAEDAVAFLEKNKDKPRLRDGSSFLILYSYFPSPPRRAALKEQILSVQWPLNSRRRPGGSCASLNGA